jgi:hypothetical protein
MVCSLYQFNGHGKSKSDILKLRAQLHRTEKKRDILKKRAVRGQGV